MVCPTCGQGYELIYEMGKVAPVAHVQRCACPPTLNPGTGRNYMWTAPRQYTASGSVAPVVPPGPFAPAPEEPLRPAEEIVDDLRDLLDELDDE